MISFTVQENLCIKMTETVAILMAIELGVKSTATNVTVLTGLKSSCVSMSCVKKLDRFYDNNSKSGQTEQRRLLQYSRDSISRQRDCGQSGHGQPVHSLELGTSNGG